MAKEQRNYDLRDLLKPYANKWVALTSNHKKVIAKGNELKEVIAKVKVKDAIFMKVFPDKSFYMPYNT